jgi:hypothetical protein
MKWMIKKRLIYQTGLKLPLILIPSTFLKEKYIIKNMHKTTITVKLVFSVLLCFS